MIYFLNMASVGTMYALTVVQFELPRLLGISQASSLLPFAAACVGLSLGVGTAAGFIQRRGARSIVAMGTSIWGLAVVGAGYSVSLGSLELISVCFLGGGVGVGWTYLAIVVAVGRDFHHHPLARSAIGPLGFSSGTAAAILLSEHLAFAALDADQLGRLMGFAGMAFILVSAAALALPTGQQSVQAPPSPVRSEEKYGPLERSWKITLFFNAFPGMAIFAALLPFASDQIHARPRVATAVTLGALAFGGLSAPVLDARLGSPGAFSLLLMLRGVLLLLYSQHQSGGLAMVVLAAVFFGHGAGFGILPILIKQRVVRPDSFVHVYGRVLVVWGLSGVAGVVVDCVLGRIVGSQSSVALALGTAAMASALIMHGITV